MIRVARLDRLQNEGIPGRMPLTSCQPSIFNLLTGGSNQMFIDGIVFVERKLLFALKHHEAIWLTELIRYEDGHNAELSWDNKPPEKWIKFTQKTAYQLTGISFQIQIRIVKKLIDIGILYKKRSEGMKAHNLYKIDHNRINGYCADILSKLIMKETKNENI